MVGWHYFWCRALDAAYTKLVGAVLLFACMSAFLGLAFGTVEVAGKAFRAGGYIGEWLAGFLADYLNRTGSIVLILTLLFLASSCRPSSRSAGSSPRSARSPATAGPRRWARSRVAGREAPRRQRQEVMRKHLGDKAPKDPKVKIAPKTPGAGAGSRARRAGDAARRGGAEEAVPHRRDGRGRRRRAQGGVDQAHAPAGDQAAAPAPIEASLPLSEPEKLPAERKQGGLHRCRRSRCSTPRRRSARSTSAS